MPKDRRYVGILSGDLVYSSTRGSSDRCGYKLASLKFFFELWDL